jgi:hypothetical protein
MLTEPSERVSEDEGHSSGFEEEETAALQGQPRSSPLALSRLLSRSRGSLLVSAIILFFKSPVRIMGRVYYITLNHYHHFVL